MNFTTKIKQELIENKMNKQDIQAFINGALFVSFKDLNSKIKIRIMNEKTFNSFLILLKKTEMKFTIEKNTFIFEEQKIENIKPKNANIYFAGMFFIAGSISNLDSSSYHLQINIKNEENCNQIIEFSSKHIIFNKTKNKNNFVIYIKKNESISDFLHILGAKNSYFEFIDSVISRDLKNQVTRIFNLDVHNQEKMVDSYQNFLENFNFIKENKLEGEFSKEQLIFYEFKKNNQFMPLSEMAIELFKQKNIKKTKGGLNHWLIKLRNVCENHDK